MITKSFVVTTQNLVRNYESRPVKSHHGRQEKWSLDSFLKLLCIFISLPYGNMWNTYAMFVLVLLAATRNCQISYKNGYVGLLVLFFLPLLNLLARSILFYRYCFDRCSSEMAQLGALPYSSGKSLIIPIDSVIFLSQI